MKAFISYSREDSGLVEPLVRDLGQLGHEVWMDTRLFGGQDWWDEILRQISICDFFVLAVSPNALDSTPCQLELGYADATRRPFLPVVVAPSNPNFFPPQIAHAQFVDYRTADKDALIALVAAIGQLPRVDLPDPLPPQPAMPESPLFEIRQLIESDELDRNQQIHLFDNLRQLSSRPKLRSDVIDLLVHFRARADVMGDVRDRIDDLLARIRQADPDVRPTDRGERDKRHKRSLIAVSGIAIALALAIIGFVIAFSTPAPPWSKPIPIKASNLDSISCTGPSFCAGIDSSDEVATTFNGTGWALQRNVLDNAAGPSSVSCTSENFCVAVDDSGNEATFNGHVWSKRTMIDPYANAVSRDEASPDNGDTQMFVSCVSTNFCAAVDGLGYALTFDGASWSETPKPIDPIPTQDPVEVFDSLSCSSNSFCLATDGTNFFVYDGRVWSNAQAAGSPFGALISLSCVSRHFCVGVDTDGTAATFNGERWSKPRTIDSNAGVSFSVNTAAVSCLSRSFCMAVYNDGAWFKYDGSKWTAPAFISQETAIDDVSCGSTSFCVASNQNGHVYYWRG
jgi:hypothetical protein